VAARGPNGDPLRFFASCAASSEPEGAGAIRLAERIELTIGMGAENSASKTAATICRHHRRRQLPAEGDRDGMDLTGKAHRSLNQSRAGVLIDALALEKSSRSRWRGNEAKHPVGDEAIAPLSGVVFCLGDDTCAADARRQWRQGLAQ